MCEQACPASLLPQQMFWFAQGKEFEKLEQHNLFDCIECGACSWVCPSNIPLVQYYRASKAEILQLREEQQRSEQSRIRFEARQERIEREEAEKTAKRAARKKAAEQRAQAAAAGGTSDEDPIQAAIDRAKAKKAAQQAGTDSPVSEREKLEKTVLTTRKRLETASAKLAQAQEQGGDLVAALQTGVDKTRQKLETAEQALQTLVESGTAGDNEDPPADPAAAAIAKAKAARAADAGLSATEKARDKLKGLEQRLEKTRARLAESQSIGEEQKIVDALASTVTRLEDKVNATREQLGNGGGA